MFWNENADGSRADNSLKNWRNLPISNPKPVLYNINVHTMFSENPLIFTQVIVRKQKQKTKKKKKKEKKKKRRVAGR